MGRKTHGPYLIAAIEYNDIEKVSEILVKQFRERKSIKDLLVSDVPRLISEHTEIPVLLAASLPDPAILKYFVTKFEVNINHVFESGSPRNRRKTTALLVAVRCGHHDTVDAILSMNADPNAGDHKGRRPLHIAIRRADYRMTKMLLCRGAQANAPDAESNTPFHYATIYGHTELVKLLLQHGADLYKKGQNGAIAIHIAAHEGHANLVRLFCQFSEVNPNIKLPCYDHKEKAPLHVAAERGHSETVFTLLEHCGAGVDIRDSEGETPLHCAVINEYDEFGMKSKEDYTETVKLLLNYGADPNTRNARGETPMHLAARNEFQKVIEVLVLAGCDPVTEDNDGNKAIDLTTESDTVSQLTLRHATVDRERYMNESMEIRARGFSTVTQRQAALPLAVRSPSLMSMPLLMGAAPSIPLITRAASTPGLFASPPQSAMLPTPYPYAPDGSGYLPPLGSRNQLATLANCGSMAGMLSPRNVSSNLAINRAQPFSPVASLQRQNSDSKQLLDNNQLNIGLHDTSMQSHTPSVIHSEAFTSITDPRSIQAPSLQNGARDASENSSFWDVTPAASELMSLDGPVIERKPQKRSGRLRKVTKEKPVSHSVKEKPVVAPSVQSSTLPSKKKVPLVFQKPSAVERIPTPPLPDEDSDSFFDDESFDTLSETGGRNTYKTPHVAHVTLLSNYGSQASLQSWLEDQAVVTEKTLSQSVMGTANTCPLYSNLPPATSSPPELPPKLSRASSTSSNDTIKKRQPPPVPVEIPENPVQRRKKKSKKVESPVENVVKVKKNGHENVQARKTVRELKKKSKDDDVFIPQHLENTQSADKDPECSSFDSSEWSSEEFTDSEKFKADTVSNCSSSITPTPYGQQFGLTDNHLTFEKISLDGGDVADSIRTDYMFNRSLAELTTASAADIVERVGRKIDSNATRIGRSTSLNSDTSSSLSSSSWMSAPLTGNNVPSYVGNPLVNQQFQTFGASYQQAHLQMGMLQQQELAALQQQQQMQQMQLYQQQMQMMNAYHPHQGSFSDADTLSPSASSPRSPIDPYEQLVEPSSKKHPSATDFLDPSYGRNLRTISFQADGKPGFTVCGGNVSGTFVLSVMQNSPAAKSGLSVGDLIIGVNQRLVKNRSKEEIMLLCQQSVDEMLNLVVVRDDDRFQLASSKNAVGDSFHVRAHFTHQPSGKGKELGIKEDDIFLVSDSMPADNSGFWVAKKISQNLNEPEGLIPNQLKAEQIITKQNLMSQGGDKQRGGTFMRSFRRSKSMDRSANSRDALDSRRSSAGEIVAYERVIQQSSPVRRPVILMGLFCDVVCSKLAKDSPGIYELPVGDIEQRRTGGTEEFTSSMLNIGVIRGIVNKGRHCLMVISPRAVQFLREKTELRPIVIYLSPVSKNVLKAVKDQLAPMFDKKISLLLEESTKFEKYHQGLFDAIVPYKVDGSWLSLLKDTVDRFQRHPQWVTHELEDRYLEHGGSSPDLIRTTRSDQKSSAEHRVSRTTDDIPDQIQDLLSRHIYLSTPTPDTKLAGDDENDFRSPQSSNCKPPKSILKNMHNRSLSAIDFDMSKVSRTNDGLERNIYVSSPTPVTIKPPKPASVRQSVTVRKTNSRMRPKKESSRETPL